MKFRIRNESTGTYLRTITAIGPAFGALWEEALTFDDGEEAYWAIRAMPMTAFVDLVNEQRQACDITGQSLPPFPGAGGTEGTK